MRGFELQYRIRARCAAAAVACALLSSAALFSAAALAQGVAPPPAPEPKPGVFESIGRFFDQGTTNFREHLQGAKRKMDDLGDEAAANSRAFGEGAATAGKNAADVTKGAVDGLAKLPTARMMTGREKCAVAPNGAPDCIAAAEQLCRKHGFASGKSMDFTSAEECPVRAYLSGGSPTQCQTVTFINRAMCQ
jgi:hypothetical protein